LEATHGFLPLEFREIRTYEQGSKIAIGKSMPGDPSTMGPVTAHSFAGSESGLASPKDRSLPF
jgi:hypothetical protein